MLAFINAANLNELFKWITIVSIILAAVAVLGKLIIMMRSSKTTKKDGDGYYSEQQPDFIDEKAKPGITYGANSKTAHNDNAKFISDRSSDSAGKDLVFLDEESGFRENVSESKKKAVSEVNRAIEKSAQKDAKYSAKKAAKEMLSRIKK